MKDEKTTIVKIKKKKIEIIAVSFQLSLMSEIIKLKKKHNFGPLFTLLNCPIKVFCLQTHQLVFA